MGDICEVYIYTRDEIIAFSPFRGPNRFLKRGLMANNGTI